MFFHVTKKFFINKYRNKLDGLVSVFRGGSTNNYGSDNLATNRNGNNTASNTAWDIGFRAVL